MTTMHTLSQANQGPRIRIERGTVEVLMNSSSEPLAGRDAQPEKTQYVDIGSERTVIVGELSKMEQILEYLKALYR